MRTNWMSPVVCMNWANITIIITVYKRGKFDFIEWGKTPKFNSMNTTNSNEWHWFYSLSNKITVRQIFRRNTPCNFWPEITIQIQFEHNSFHQMPACLRRTLIIDGTDMKQNKNLSNPNTSWILLSFIFAPINIYNLQLNTIQK